jgi:hypothetical protein
MKEVTVLSQPLTKILIADNVNEEEAKTRWLAKYHRRDIDEQQARREKVSIREGKMSQFKTMKT